MSSLWLHVSEIPSNGSSVAVSRDEARHAFGARRLGVGDSVTLFDGRGALSRGTLLDARARDGSLLVEVSERRDEPRLEPEITIAFAVPKGDRLSTLLDLATQAGASRLVAIECARSVVDADKLDRGERWQRVVAESAKVAKRAWMPELATGGELIAFARGERARGAAVAVAHTDETMPRTPLVAWSAALEGGDTTRPRTVLIGPEGGFEPREITELAANSVACVSLGPCVMRVEMAAIAAAVLLRG